MRRITFTADEIRALCYGVDFPEGLDDDDYSAKFGTNPGTKRHKVMVAAYESAIHKLRAVNRNLKRDA
jgi:hypothetical protein